jgi:DNA-binding NtrC family response regulator
MPVDVRILAATNADVGERIRAKQFREDLYYRLSVMTIHLPALEERQEDIPLLVRHFLSGFNERNARQVTLNEEATRLLMRMSWPGNVRELENLIERAAILSTTGEISAEDIERASGAGALSSAKVVEPATTLKEVERQQIMRALREAQGNRSLAARKLGIERKTLYKKAQRLGIDLEAPDK